MRLLLITSYLDDGGAEKWMLDTTKNMDRSDVYTDYYFFCGKKRDVFEDIYKSLGINLHFRDLDRKKGRLEVNFRKDLKLFIEEHGPYDAVHINGTKIVFQMIAMEVSKKAGIPQRIVHSHNSKSQNLSGIKKAIRDYARNKTIRNATVVGACGLLAGTEKYGQSIVENPKFYIFKNGIDAERFAFNGKNRIEIRTEYGIKDEPVILHVGRLDEQKNQSFLLEVFAELLKKVPEAKLFMVGRGPDQEMLDKQIESLGIRTSVIPVSYTASVQKYYSASDLFLLPSRWEGLPFVKMEAQANGIPMLISTTVTKEGDVNSNLSYLPLENPVVWADISIRMMKKRVDGVYAIKSAGYDLKDTAKDFKEICLKKSGAKQID